MSDAWWRASRRLALEPVNNFKKYSFFHYVSESELNVASYLSEQISIFNNEGPTPVYCRVGSVTLYIIEMTDEWATFDEIFGINSGAAQALAAEHLADTTDYFSNTYEITINIKQDKMSKLEHLQVYKDIWAHLLKQYNVVNHSYHVEKCESQQFHIHGYMTVKHHINSYCYEDSFFLRAFAKQIFLILPRKYWKQYINAKYDGALRRLKCPAVCLNLKNVISQNWTNYIEKNAQKKCV